MILYKDWGMVGENLIEESDRKELMYNSRGIFLYWV